MFRGLAILIINDIMLGMNDAQTKISSGLVVNWQFGQVVKVLCYEFPRSNIAGSNNMLARKICKKPTANSAVHPLVGW